MSYCIFDSPSSKTSLNSVHINQGSNCDEGKRKFGHIRIEFAIFVALGILKKDLFAFSFKHFIDDHKLLRKKSCTLMNIRKSP